jgi:pyrroloquinoline quinone biosynthesis protein D
MPPPIRPETLVPRLAAHARLGTDPLTKRPLLLYPEGILELDETAAALLGLCDGRRSLRQMSVMLAEEYDAPVEEIGRDAGDYLEGLKSKGLVSLEERAP